MNTETPNRSAPAVATAAQKINRRQQYRFLVVAIAIFVLVLSLFVIYGQGSANTGHQTTIHDIFVDLDGDGDPDHLFYGEATMNGDSPFKNSVLSPSDWPTPAPESNEFGGVPGTGDPNVGGVAPIPTPEVHPDPN